MHRGEGPRVPPSAFYHFNFMTRKGKAYARQANQNLARAEALCRFENTEFAGK
jgi:hypothetical protein